MNQKFHKILSKYYKKFEKGVKTITIFQQNYHLHRLVLKYIDWRHFKGGNTLSRLIYFYIFGIF